MIASMSVIFVILQSLNVSTWYVMVMDERYRGSFTKKE